MNEPTEEIQILEDRALTAQEVEELRDDPMALLEPDNSSETSS
jgi:hypothetical protein